MMKIIKYRNYFKNSNWRTEIKKMNSNKSLMNRIKLLLNCKKI